MGLTVEICKQIGAFYFPNKFIHKELLFYYFDPDLHERELYYFDTLLAQKLDHPVDSGFLLTPRYGRLANLTGVGRYEQLPFLFGGYYLFQGWFDKIFITALLLFIGILLYRRRLFSHKLILVFHLAIFIYVMTIAIVHTFDIERFIITIYPFLLIATSMTLVSIIDFAGAKICKVSEG